MCLQLQWSNLNFICIPAVQINFISRENSLCEKKTAETALHVFNITEDARGSHGIQAGWAVGESGGFIPKVPVCLCWAPQHEV